MDPKYTLLFNAITDAVNELENLRGQLITAQQQSEELYVESAE